MDGVFAFRPELDRFWDLRIWLHVDERTALRRYVEHDRGWAETWPRSRSRRTRRISSRVAAGHQSGQ